MESAQQVDDGLLVRQLGRRLIIVDPDHIEASNLERMHGTLPTHAAKRALIRFDIIAGPDRSYGASEETVTLPAPASHLARKQLFSNSFPEHPET